MYLTDASYLSNFIDIIRNRKAKSLKVKTAFFLGLLLQLVPVLLVAQQPVVYPGDINDNGIVNNVDVLFWSRAVGATGPERTFKETDFLPVPAGEEWGQSFPDGVNYRTADANGDGIVDEADLEIIRANFNRRRTSPPAEEDVFTIGQPLADPAISLNGQDVTNVLEGENFEIDIDFEDPFGKIDTFWGVGFQIHYNRDPDGNGNPEPFSFDISRNGASWLGTPGEDADVFLFDDKEQGIVNVVVYRKGSGVTTIGNTLGTMIVIIEDINFGINKAEATFENFDRLKLVDGSLTDVPVYLDPMDNSLAVTIDMIDGTVHYIKDNTLMKVYPVPSKDFFTIKLDDVMPGMDYVEVLDMQGRTLIRRKSDGKELTMNLGDLESGIYLLKVFTSEGVFVRQITK